MQISPQSRDLAGLCPCIRRLWLQLDVLAAEKGIDLKLIETIRQPDRQEYYVRIGASQTMESKHLPQPPNGLSLAFDCAPKSYLTEPLWAPHGPLWDEVGKLSRKLGLLWGGDWRTFRDAPHYYLERCRCQRGDPVHVADQIRDVSK